jgi:hypothetical protein
MKTADNIKIEFTKLNYINVTHIVKFYNRHLPTGQEDNLFSLLLANTQQSRTKQCK